MGDGCTAKVVVGRTFGVEKPWPTGVSASGSSRKIIPMFVKFFAAIGAPPSGKLSENIRARIAD